MTADPLVEFLLARIAEDDFTAFTAAQDEQLLGPLHELAMAPDDHRGAHAARWSPARVRAHCDVRQRLIRQSQETGADGLSAEYEHGYDDAMDFALRLLALPYASHPDYREEWRP